MKPLLPRACRGFSFILPAHWSWLGRSLAISLAIHLLLFSSFHMVSPFRPAIQGEPEARIQARIAKVQERNVLPKVSDLQSGEPRSMALHRARRHIAAVSADFLEKQPFTAAVRNSSSLQVGQSEYLTSPRLDGLEIAAYRISVARAVRKWIVVTSGMPAIQRRTELVLELHFGKPIAPPYVSILKSSGDQDVDRIYAESVTKVAEELPPPGNFRRYPYRVELTVSIPAAEP